MEGAILEGVSAVPLGCEKDGKWGRAKKERLEQRVMGGQEDKGKNGEMGLESNADWDVGGAANTTDAEGNVIEGKVVDETI